MLTAKQVKNARPKAKVYKLTDGHGLYVQINKSGNKFWRMAYRWEGKQRTLSLGEYPIVSLAKARDKHRAARVDLSNGIDPGAKPEETAEGATFEQVAREWIDKQAQRWSAEHTRRVRLSLEQDVFPDLGAQAIDQINAPQLLATLRRIEARGALETLSKVHQRCGAIFRYGIATGRCERDVAADLRGAFTTRKEKHHASLTEAQLPEFFAALDAYDGDRRTALAIELVLLTMVRTSELRFATWDEFDFDKAEWRIPAERMKMGEMHIVPLSPQAIGLLHAIRLDLGTDWVLPSLKNPSKPVSENTLLFGMYRLGYHGRATIHGLRGTASTILNENGWRADVIERQLAHGERDNVRRAYNHAVYRGERKQMMIWWGDYLEGLRK